MNNATEKRKVLGRGLSALISQRGTSQAPAATAPAHALATDLQSQESTKAAAPTQLATGAILPNPAQPRTVFELEKLEELAQSIRVNGIIQPLIVRRTANAEEFELIAGERRLRAAKLAGLDKVPVVVQEIAEHRLLEVALIENIQREDLNPIELALAYDRLIRELNLSQEEIGQRTGKDRSSIANTIRLLKLPMEVQKLVSEGRLSMGQARALITLPDQDEQIRIAEKAVSQGLSARQVEGIVRQLTSDPATGGTGPTGQTSKDASQSADPNVLAAQQELQSVLATRVRIVEQSDQRGRIEIHYFTQDELTRLYEQIVGK